jgi:hypothetical protein
MPLNFFSSGSINVPGAPYANNVRRSIVLKLWEKQEPISLTELSKELKLDVKVLEKELEAMTSSEVVRSIQHSGKEPIYTLNIPVISLEDQEKLRKVLEIIAEEISKVYMKNLERLQEAFETTSLAKKGNSLKDVEGFIKRFISEEVDLQLLKTGLTQLTWQFEAGKNYRFWCEETD